MVIRRGEAWGVADTCPGDLVVADDDAALAALLGDREGPTPAALAGDHPPLAVSGGDLHRTVGAPAVPRPGERCRRLPVDLLRCELDGSSRLAVAHVVVRRPGPLGWWRGPILAVCTAQFHGRWDVAPRGHPNDGRADVLEVSASMPAGQRRLARRRLPSGTHVPHPDITTTRVTRLERDLLPGLVVHLDHRPVRGVRRLTIEVLADAYELHV